MKWTWQTSVAIVAAVAILAIVNLHCWSPGVGTRTDGVGGARPQGTELKRSFGWPACYRAELWRSDDPQLFARVLQSAPFYYPDEEMVLAVRRVGRWAIVLDGLSAVLIVVLVGIIFGRPRKEWEFAWTVCAAIVGAMLIGLVWLAPRVSVHL